MSRRSPYVFVEHPLIMYGEGGQSALVCVGFNYGLGRIGRENLYARPSHAAVYMVNIPDNCHPAAGRCDGSLEQVQINTIY